MALEGLHVHLVLVICLDLAMDLLVGLNLVALLLDLLAGLECFLVDLLMLLCQVC